MNLFNPGKHKNSFYYLHDVNVHFIDIYLLLKLKFFSSLLKIEVVI